MIKAVKKPNPDTGMLSRFSQALDAMAATDKVAHEALMQKLGEPAVFVPDTESWAGNGTGYWKCEAGVVSYRRYANGYSAASRLLYPTLLIDTLMKVQRGIQPDPVTIAPHAGAPTYSNPSEIRVGDTVTLTPHKKPPVWWTVIGIDQAKSRSQPDDTIHLERSIVVQSKTVAGSSQLKIIQKKALRRDCTKAGSSLTIREFNLEYGD